MIPCVNCKKNVDPNDGKLFAAVFVCPTCYLIATRIYERSERELKALQLVLKEAIRVELMEGRLQFSTMEQVDEVPKKDLLGHLQDAAQKARRGVAPPMPSKETTWPAPSPSSEPPALTAGSKPEPDSR